MELTDGTVPLSGNDYRLQNMVEIQKTTRTRKSKTRKINYNKSLKAVNAAEGVLAVSFMGLNTVSVVFLSTVVAAPAVTAIEAVSLGAFIIGGFVSRSLIPRAEKHERIKLLTDKKLNLTSDLCSKAINDVMISDEEYSLIFSELNKFIQKKEQIRKKAKAQIDKESKRSLINKFKAKATQMIRKH